MTRVGIYTGTLYSQEDFDNRRIFECCVVLTDEQAKDADYIRSTYERKHTACADCMSCEESRVWRRGG